MMLQVVQYQVLGRGDMKHESDLRAFRPCSIMCIRRKLISSGPSIDPNACIGSIVSNGRIFHTSQGGGLRLSLIYGSEAAADQSKLDELEETP
jgi:hypothetical protein